MGRSSSVPWSPPPMNDAGMSRPSDYTAASRKYANTSDMWSANNADSKASDLWSPSQMNANGKRSDLWSPIPYTNKSMDRHSLATATHKSEVWSSGPRSSKVNDFQSTSQSNGKSSDIWSTKQNNKNSEVWTTTHVTTKTVEPWSGNNSFTKTTESTMINNDSSSLPMVKRFEKHILSIRKSLSSFSLVPIHQKNPAAYHANVRLGVNSAYLVFPLDSYLLPFRWLSF